MIRIIFLVCVLRQTQGQLAPLIFAAPSAVSHQSRIDIRHTPGFISTPFLYSPIAPYTTVKESESVLPPVLRPESYFTPVALTFFHNLPLARALENPISIEKVQEAALALEKLNAVIVEKVHDTENNGNVDVEVVTDTDATESNPVYESIPT